MMMSMYGPPDGKLMRCNDGVTLIGTGNTPLIAASNKRRTLILSNAGSSAVYLRFGETAVLSQGMLLANGVAPTVLHWYDIGDMITQAINGIAAAGSPAVWWAAAEIM